MKKLFAVITFTAGAVFGMLFSTKKGEEIRRRVTSQRSREEKAEAIASEAKDMAKSFWKTIKGPLMNFGEILKNDAEKYGPQAKKKLEQWKDKAVQEVKREAKKYGKEYGPVAKKKFEWWKKRAVQEIKKDAGLAKKEFKRAAKKAKSTAGKKLKQVKKQVKKKFKR